MDFRVNEIKDELAKAKDKQVNYGLDSNDLFQNIY